MVSHKAILLVDDDNHVLKLIDIMLRRLGYPVVKAPNAELALHLIKSFSPNLFILDVLMPGMNGFELCQAIRGIPHTAHTPVIILTVMDNYRSKARAFEVGANAFVPKADLSNELLPHILALLNGSSPEVTEMTDSSRLGET